MDRSQGFDRQHSNRPVDPSEAVLPAFVLDRRDALGRIEDSAFDLCVVGQGEQLVGPSANRRVFCCLELR